jgi:hypothetical protein
MIEKLVLATAVTFALNIFIGINHLSAAPKVPSMLADTVFQAATLTPDSALQNTSQ